VKAGNWVKKMARLSTMYQKKKGLAMNGENLKEIYLIQTKMVTEFSVAEVTEKKRVKKWGQSSLSY